MGKLGKITLIMAVAITVLSGFSGCKAEPQTELTPAKKACIEMMQQVPVYYEDFEFWDVKTLRNDPDLSEINHVWQERRGDWLGNFNIASSDMDYVAEAEVLTMAKGDFGLQSIRESLSDGYYLDTSYADAEVWVAKEGGALHPIGGAVTLAEGFFVWGNQSNIDDYLRVTSGEELSMYDANAAVLLDRLPEGIMTRISRYSYPEGLILTGVSIIKEEKNILKWTNVYKFESNDDVQSADVERYFKGIEDEFKEAESIFAEQGQVSLFNTFSIQYDGQFVTWSMLIDEKYMIALLFYG